MSNEQQVDPNRILIERITNLLNAGFHGGAWHGPSVLEAVKRITPKEASFKTPTVHTGAELIYHITSWRIFTLKKLQGDADYKIDDDKKNFGPAAKVDQFELETLLMELSLSQDELIKELNSKDDDFLNELVPGTEYDYYTLLHGIIQHDIYHTGQIIILKKMSEASGAYEDEDEMTSSRYFDDGLGDAY
ncbi:DinB family protein [Jiulongibacter sp. NS-SX5]|uniref:DinB family protein n=1 Tax=Jiulongibacter sp. NS-SX5 TaxID=3463854 RepID=UPI0040582CE3